VIGTSEKGDVKQGGEKMKKLWIGIGAICLIAVWIGLENRASAAETFPVKPINFIIPLEAGSDGDILARPLCQKASAILGQPIIIVNKPGAGSSIGYREVHSAKPDGYTVGYGMATLLTNKMQGIMPLDFADYTIMSSWYYMGPIIMAATKTQRPFKTIQEVIAFAKSHPGELSLATGAVGQSWWVATMAFVEGTGLKFNIIPQPGAGGLTTTHVAGGHSDLGVTALPTAMPQLEAGNIRLLASLEPKRAPAPYDNVPTIKELGYDVSYESFGIVIGPPKMPNEISAKIAKAFIAAANDPEYKKFLLGRYSTSFVLPADEATKYINEKRILLRKIMDKAGILKEK
jgi:tripartite-type tricarboxylate transporter receptor subunit TctC